MSDERGQPNPSTEEPSPDSLLTARLLSRATDSLGLIDVRGAERHYARIMDWLAARNPLLEHLRTRYGMTEGEGLTGLAFAEARGRDDSQPSDERLNLPAAPGNIVMPDAEQIFTRVAHIPDDADAEQTETKRIARRGQPTFSPASPKTGPAPGASPARGEVVRQEHGEVFRPALELAEPTREQAHVPQATPRVKETPAANAEHPGAPPAETPQASRPRPASGPAEESTSSPARPTMPSVEERVATPATEQEQTLARGSAPSTRSVVARRSTEPNDAAAVKTPTDANEPSVAARPGSLRVTESRGLDALPLVHASTAPVVSNEDEGMTLKRRVAVESEKGAASLTANVTLPVASETRAPLATGESSRPLARASEVHTGEMHGGEMHGGDSVHASSPLQAQPPLPLAASPAAVVRAAPSRPQNGSASVVLQQNEDAHAVTRTASGGAETFAPGRTRAGGRTDDVNIQRLTEQVSRHLARRLLVERERRGWGRR